MTTQQRLRVVCAPDKMRGALDAAAVAAALALGVRDAGHEPVEHPVADGGEGSRDAVVAAVPGSRLIQVDAVDALGRPARTAYGLLPDGTAVVEASDVIGLAPLAEAERDVFAASSRGLAAPIKAAVTAGARKVVVLLGGTANMDGGLGLLVGLGARVADADGRALPGSGADLARVGEVDVVPAREVLAGVELVIATDVRSPLHGSEGAAYVFGPQKGADAESVRKLDAGLRRLAPLLGEAARLPGAGAAGGLGAALAALGGQIVGGADLILSLTRLDEALAGASLCLTAEGQVDSGSAAGKVVGEVLGACRRAGVPCVIVAGAVTADVDLYFAGAAAVMAIGRRPRPLEAAMAATAADLRATARAVVTLADQSRQAHDRHR
jgi:glycerate kinase